MLRTLLIATALLTTSGAALARDGRVISVEPSFSISFGTRHHDGFRVLYESGGHHYWGHSPHHPGQYFVLQPQYYVQSNYGYRDHGYHEYVYRDHGWSERDKHHRKDHRKYKRHDRDDDHDDDRKYRRHGKD